MGIQPTGCMSHFTVPNCLDEIVTASYIMGHEIALQSYNILAVEFNNKIINFEKSRLSQVLNQKTLC